MSERTPQEERIFAVLEGVLPDEILSASDVELLAALVDSAIMEKFEARRMVIADGAPQNLH